jgi:uncharacterized protein (UPF0212 family)
MPGFEYFLKCKFTGEYMVYRIQSLILLVLLLSYNLAFAQEGEGGCPMCGAMGMGGMILFAVVVLALISVLISLSVFLIRRSRHKD